MRFQNFTLLALVLGALASPVKSKYDPATACAIVSSSASSFLSHSPKAAPTIAAQLGYDCLNSVPLHASEATKLVESILPFIEWQTTIEYLKEPPRGYTEPAVDLRARFAAVLAKITSGFYKSEYEFQAALWKVVNSEHDGHFRFLPDLLSKAIGFTRPFTLVSVSFDGVSSPQIYSYTDNLLSRNSTFVPSALATIDGKKATTYIEDLSQLGVLNDPDASYNSMFYNPQNAAEPGGWNGYFAGAGRFAWIYPGSNTKIIFKNGTTLIIENTATVIGNFTRVTDGNSFFQKFCVPKPLGIPTVNTTTTTTTTTAIPTAIATAKPIVSIMPSGYPQPLIKTADGQVSGYYLHNSNVAVLAMLTFQPLNAPVEWQQVIEKFFAAAKADGKLKLVIDLSANGGGLLPQAVDTFRQLFPQIIQDGYTRFRDTPSLKTIAKIVSNKFPPGFNPETSSNNTLISLYELAPNYRFDYDIDNQYFSSYDEKFAPHEYHGDNFTNITRWNWDDPLITINTTYGSGYYVTGYGPRTNYTQPFAAEDIIMIYDGFCASACSTFSEFMRTQAGVKSIAFGGRPSSKTSPPIIQAYGGTKGANVWSYPYLNSLVNTALQFNVTAAQRAILEPLTNMLPIQRSTDTSLNVGDNILPDNLRDGTPAQFIYEPADCRLFYTPAMMANVTAIWEAAAQAAWGEGKCNAGSLP